MTADLPPHELLGPYVLGRLDDDARAAVETAIARSPELAAEARALARVADLLALIEPDDLDALGAPPPADLRDRVIAAATDALDESLADRDDAPDERAPELDAPDADEDADDDLEVATPPGGEPPIYAKKVLDIHARTREADALGTPETHLAHVAEVTGSRHTPSEDEPGEGDGSPETASPPSDATTDDLAEVASIIGAAPETSPADPTTTTGETDETDEPAPAQATTATADGAGSDATPTPATVRELPWPVRKLVGAAAAVLALIAIAVGTSMLLSEPDPGLGVPEVVEFQVDDADLDVHDSSVVPHTWGTEVFLTMSGTQTGVDYAVDLELLDGRIVSAGSFVGDDELEVVCVMNGAALREDVRAIVVRTFSGSTVMRADLAPVDYRSVQARDMQTTSL